MKVIAISKNRYNGGIKVKRLYGSSTITIFWVMREEDKDDPSKWVEIEVGGKTPGERMSKAKEVGAKVLEGK